jgi:zinc D-Ala-D-Ala carboxypeptidase
MAAYLKQGDSGEKVRAAQVALNYLGHNCGTADGIWGPKTEAAVRAFQTKQNLGISADDYDILVQMGAPKKPGTAHFTLEEFEVHDRSLESLWQPTPVQYYPDVQALFEQLEILRHAIGDIPIVIRSGYRCPAYNAKVGGESGSQHVFACAADIYCIGYSPNCYNLGKYAHNQFYKGGLGGVGLGANVNVHVDLRHVKNCTNRTSATYWWYTYKSWAEWEAHQ